MGSQMRVTLLLLKNECTCQLPVKITVILINYKGSQPEEAGHSARGMPCPASILWLAAFVVD